MAMPLASSFALLSIALLSVKLQREFSGRDDGNHQGLWAYEATGLMA